MCNTFGNEDVMKNSLKYTSFYGCCIYFIADVLLVENFRSYGNRGRSNFSHRGRGRGGSRGNSPGPRSRLDSDGDLVMGDEEPQPSRSRL